MPLWLVILSYFIYDPFKVLYHYDNFYEDYFVNINRDYASSQLFIQNNATQHYNSFIFGSSRTMAFRTKDWKNHIGQTEKPFVFDASSETLTGIWSKVKFLEEQKVSIKHALIVVCGDHTFAEPQTQTNLLFIRHPNVYKKENWLQFQELFFSTYFKNYFFIHYLDYQIFRQKRAYLYKNIEFIELKVDTVTNDLYRTDLDRKRELDSLSYYKEIDCLFYKHSDLLQYRVAQLDESKINMLRQIKTVFDKEGTDYQFIISPLYDQKRINEKDLKMMKAIFGEKQVHDFSGINAITSSKFNYYENSHYIPSVGKAIMDSIYSK